MKLKILVPSLFFLFTLTVLAQNTENNISADNRYFSLTFGLNMIDNGGNSVLPFDGNKINFNTPFFLTAEQRIKNNWSLSLMLSTNKLELYNPSIKAPYFSSDLFANLYLDDLIFNNDNIDLYVGLGTGIHTVDGKGAGSFNFTGGLRFWLSDKVAINLQSIGKVNYDGIAQVDNHYQFNLGVTFKFRSKKQDKIDTNIYSTKNPVNIEQEENQTGIRKYTPTNPPLENSNKDVVPKYNVDTDATSTELAKTPEEQQMIKNNVANILNTKTLNTTTDGVKKGYHVIVYAFEKKSNLDNMVRNLSQKGIEVQVIKIAIKNLNYISVAYFKTIEEAHNYINNTLDTELFKDSWVYEVD